jgi:predicted esterase
MDFGCYTPQYCNDTEGRFFCYSLFFFNFTIQFFLAYMKDKIFAILAIKIYLLCLFSSCFIAHKSDRNLTQSVKTKLDTLVLFDSARHRRIPIAFYTPKTSKKEDMLKIVIFSHGYGNNRGGDYLAYSYLTQYLAENGYFVASIQHELPSDEPIAMTGNFQETRRPNWERGVQNILFVINTLKKTKPYLDFQHLTLIGHSNGGDMSLLFVHTYPDLLDKIISLDNRRASFPRLKKPKIYSLRSSDQVADKGVLLDKIEQDIYGAKIIKLDAIKHNDMDDSGSKAQHLEINKYVLGFLNEK